MSLPPLRSFAATCKDKGKRPNQEDYVLLTPSHGVCLCDGMGGHSDGEKASHMVTAAFLYEIDWQKALRFEDDGRSGEPLPPFRIREASPATIKQQLRAAFHAANDELRKAKEAGAVGADAGCTLIAAYICGDRVFFVSVGDSLIYLYRREEGLRLYNENFLDTKERELRAMKVPEDEIRRHPQRNALVRAVVGKHVSPHIFPEEGLKLSPGDCIVLASDGILPLVESDSGKKVLSHILSSPRDDSAEKIVQAVLKKNSPKQDNVSVVLIGYKALSNRDEFILHHSSPAQHGISIDSYPPSAYRRKSIVRSLAIFITCLLIFALGIFSTYLFLTEQQDTVRVSASSSAGEVTPSQNLALDGQSAGKDNGKKQPEDCSSRKSSGDSVEGDKSDSSLAEDDDKENGSAGRSIATQDKVENPVKDVCETETSFQQKSVNELVPIGTSKDGVTQGNGASPTNDSDENDDAEGKNVSQPINDEKESGSTAPAVQKEIVEMQNSAQVLNEIGTNTEQKQDPNVSGKSPAVDDVNDGEPAPTPVESTDGNAGDGSVKWEEVLNNKQYALKIAGELNSYLKGNADRKLLDKYKVLNFDKYYQGIQAYIAGEEKDPVKIMVLYALLTKNGERQRAFENEIATIEDIVNDKKNDEYSSLKKYVLKKISGDKKIIQENIKK